MLFAPSLSLLYLALALAGEFFAVPALALALLSYFIAARHLDADDLALFPLTFAAYAVTQAYVLLLIAAKKILGIPVRWERTEKAAAK